MDTLVIDPSKITFIKQPADTRTFSKELAVLLATSIKEEGLLQPILIRKDPDREGLYLGVDGKHRHYAVSKVLKLEGIDAILTDMDEKEAGMATITANLMRNPLTKAQHLVSLGKWWAYYAERHPDKATPGAAQAQGKKDWADRRKADEAAAAAASPGSSPIAPEPPPKPEETFVEKVAAATGASKSTAARDVKIAKTFSADELEVFEQCGVGKVEMLVISKIKDAKLRGEVIALIAAGMEVDDAIKEVMKDEAPAPFDKSLEKAKSEKAEAKAATKAEAAPELDDDAWFALHCGEKAALLGNPAKFKADALFYRATTEARHAFRLKVKKPIADSRKGGITGPFLSLVSRLVNVSHPKDWFLCEACAGRGRTGGEDGHDPCKSCLGGGFKTKTEQYL